MSDGLSGSRIWAGILSLTVLVFSAGVTASEEYGEGPKPLTNVVSLSATATGEAPNDLMRATVVVQVEGEDPARLQSQVNASMQWALARLKPYTSIKHKTLDYRTQPNYDSKHRNIIGWRASQSLQLETEDVKAAGEAIQTLQERLQVSGIRFEPKPETRRQREDQLIHDALDAFKDRALLVQSNMGMPSYTVLDIHVNTESHGGPMYRGENMRASTMDMAAPGLEGGSSEIRVFVNGRIQLGAFQ